MVVAEKKYLHFVYFHVKIPTIAKSRGGGEALNEPLFSVLAEREEESQGTEKHLRWLAYLKWLGIKAEKVNNPETEQGEE